MKKDNPQPTDKMTSQPGCYHSDCGFTPKWGIMSSVPLRNPDGTPLTLFACDDHYGALTGQLMEAKTRYSLYPINGPHIVSPHECEPPSGSIPPDEPQSPKTTLGMIFFFGACVAVGTIIAPFMILYYGGKWVFGWRPSRIEEL